MKLSVLPKFNLNPTEEELAYTHPPLYKGTNKFASYILNRFFYILAFIIPFFTMLFIMKHFAYAPFGNKCMYVLDGAYINLPVLTGMIHDLKEGTFHLYTLKGSVGAEFFSSITYYLSSPFTLICLFFSQETAVVLLSLFSVLRIALSGPIFLYYLTHRKLGHTHSPYDPMMLILSLGYALSSYGLVQYNDFMFLDHFMLFPLLLLYLEEFMISGKWKKFAFLNAFLLFSNFYLGIMLNIILVFYYFIKNENPISVIMQRFAKLVATMLFSCALSGITVIPGICAFVQNCQKPYMELFTGHLQGDFYAVFLRHLFYTAPSFKQTSLSGLNVYTGLFAFMLAFSYFLCKKFSLTRRAKDLLFLILLVLSFSSMQLSYYIHLLSVNGTYFCSYSFVYLAFLLVLGSDVLPHIRSMSLLRILSAAILPIALSILCLNLVSLQPDYNSVYYSLCILIVYGIFLLLYRIGSIKRDSFYAVILCICCLELFANAFQLSFQVAKENTSMKDVIITNGTTVTAEDEFSRAELVDFPEVSYLLNLNSRFHFNRMMTQLQADFNYTPLHDSLSGVRYLYSNKNSDFKINSRQYEKTGSMSNYNIFENKNTFPSAFAVSGTLNDSQINRSTFITEQNSIASSLGCEDSIYIETFPENVNLTLSEDIDFSVLDLGNNVFSIQAPEEEITEFTVNPTLHFTAVEDGYLYLLLHGNPVLFGEVKAGETYSHTFAAEISDIDDVVAWFQFFYYNDSAHENLAQTLAKSACSLSYDGLSSFVIKANVSEDSTIVTSLPYHSRMKTAFGTAEDITLSSYQDMLAIHVPAGTHDIKINYMNYPFILGCFLTLFVIALCIIVVKSAKAGLAMQRLYNKCSSFCTLCTRKVLAYVSDNQIYILAFIIPLGSILGIMLFSGCEPFGIKSIFNGDGPSITLPTMYHISDLLKNGLYAHSWYGGNGYNTSDFIQFSLVELLYYFVPAGKINLFTTLLVVFTLCLCGPSIVFYLTHRLTGKRAYKKDYRLLIPAMCYTLCNYSLLMINNTGWYYALVLLPLIILGMDYLMIKKKSRYYVIALGLSLLTQYYLTMFICFFLVVYFFTYHFDSIRDFIKKGIRFAVASLSTGLLSFSSLYFAFAGKSGNTYAQTDSTFPSSYFFNGFDHLFNSLSIFADGFNISWADGDANLYFGILSLFLLAVFLLQKVSLREKLRFLIPFAIFFFALNHSVLNYVFNGLHYQNGVPNRFAFLVVIAAAFISYDSICLLQKTSRRKILFAALGVLALFTISYAITPEDTKNHTAYIGTIVCLIIYATLLCKPFFLKCSNKFKTKLLVALFILELVINAAFQMIPNFSTTYYLSHMDSAIKMVNEDYNMSDSLEHVAIYSPDVENLSYVSKLKTGMQFSTMLTESQINLAKYLGSEATPNIIRAGNTQTPLGYGIGNVKYLLLFTKSYTSNIQDIKYLTPIALQDSTIIFENKQTFPFAYYLPKSASSLMNRPLGQQEYWNELTHYVLDTDSLILYAASLENCTNKDAASYPEENYFVANKIVSGDTFHYNLDMQLTVPRDGSVYINRADFQYVGEYKAGEKIHYVMDGRSINSNLKTNDETGNLIMYVLDNDLFTDLNTKINENPFHVDSFTNDSICGTIDMPEDGYVNFTMPYDERWQVWIDGEKADSESLGNGFFTVSAPKGTHEIRLNYVDNRRLPVVLITILSWIALGLICKIKDKRNSKKA